jgi:hypothetical protein
MVFSSPGINGYMETEDVGLEGTKGSIPDEAQKLSYGC